MAAPARKPRGAGTRASILQAAEDLFAAKGFEGTRLAEVAERVGIQRPAIAYYFRTKRDLYDAVLESLVGGIFERVQTALTSPAPLPRRIEDAVSAWVGYVGSRPAFARILLREVAAGTGGRAPDVVRHLQPFFGLVERVAATSGQKAPGDDPPIDPIHFASTVAGATVFFVAAMPVLIPDVDFDPLDAHSLELHRKEILRVTRRLLTIGAPQLQPRTNGSR